MVCHGFIDLTRGQYSEGLSVLRKCLLSLPDLRAVRACEILDCVRPFCSVQV